MNALFKLISGILAVGYDELRQREKQRQFWHRVRLSAIDLILALLTWVVYVAVAEAGLIPPGGARIRAFLDRHQASVLRSADSNAEIRCAASSLRRDVFEALHHGQTAEGWIAPSLKSFNVAHAVSVHSSE